MCIFIEFYSILISVVKEFIQKLYLRTSNYIFQEGICVQIHYCEFEFNYADIVVKITQIIKINP